MQGQVDLKVVEALTQFLERDLPVIVVVDLLHEIFHESSQVREFVRPIGDLAQYMLNRLGKLLLVETDIHLRENAV